ncbi:DsbE family thiol:disulfide interchange protein [Amaricoccus sp.]|uniref:DsbE family thiol:disulfide interchange protein n=1 Tax=Amaricoccus sp. TaxID=1872485 RepID=UPI001B47449E|nr:DsbE family thiol:disulfide interchange protein [Amaricoccus sp.]MBP7002713.1 DsbE family thiol:disulfide interchange protein [Amaricoccus sp.]
MRRNVLIALPPLLFLAFAAIAFVALKSAHRDELPSALTGHPAPSLAGAGALGDLPQVDDAMLRSGEITLVNFWASWCGPCRIEHPELKALAAAGVRVVGVNYKDDPAKAAGFLAELGDPYAAVATDPTGRIALDWGIYGVPETFVVAGDGAILLRYPGPLTPEIVTGRITPLLSAAGGS